ncbi:sugar phosphate isomerase/epimerase [Domibacillus sp. A3M-37]|uniref:sugar phosphate isomerase/epimerase family protein n=1 Tax=Domibacillus sp. A3M-37 TaxID=2962037 RepID=UPI0020B6BD65|nr:sugar phosphate isomerase/epimerase [Domibacillus sp. A3M-37]MCP3762091.1 sugar phosphate isomerase/epimerase [Domibacillus sp. A3M-37]
MKLGVFAVLFSDLSLEDMLDHIKEKGIHTVEIGAGGYIGDAHCKPEELLADDEKCRAFKQAFDDRDISISALSCHGNPLHPNPEIAKDHHEKFVNAVKLAAKLGVDTVVNFSGCPGESDYSKHPVWITCPWPNDFSEVVEWQWREKVIPYWKEQAMLLEDYGVKAAIEPHPGFCVYNTETALRLRKECGEQIGVNFDPSHYFWQGMNPVQAIKALGQENALFHFHAKDTQIESRNCELNGVLDTKSYKDINSRSWVFRTVGYGHGEGEWRDIISALQVIGYEGAISIEHEDGLMSIDEGFTKAVDFLQGMIIHEGAKDLWWA